MHRWYRLMLPIVTIGGFVYSIVLLIDQPESFVSWLMFVVYSILMIILIIQWARRAKK
jgi:hypothetical protein